MDDVALLTRVSKWIGWPLDSDQINRLRAYADWLVREALPAGGIGPNEGGRVLGRHVADSLLFSRAWPPPTPPRSLMDLGSGVGLPGIPLSLLWPRTTTVLVERSGRRVDLLRRACRVVDVGDVEVVQGDAATLSRQAELVVARALADPSQVMGWAGRLVAPGGKLVVGASHVEAPVPLEGEEILTVPAGVLDHPVWLRMMAPS